MPIPPPPSPGPVKVVNLGFGLNNEPKYILTWVNKGRGRFGPPWTIWVCADVEDWKGKEIRKEFGEFKQGVCVGRGFFPAVPQDLHPAGCLGLTWVISGLGSGLVSDRHTYSRSNHRTRYTCSPAEDWPPPLDLSSDGDVDATVLRELYPDSPPGWGVTQQMSLRDTRKGKRKKRSAPSGWVKSYEECVGPGATQLYVPTDAPPPYSLTDSCPALDRALDAGSGRSPGQHQQAQRPQGQSDFRTISVDTLPPYEAVCGASPPPSGLLPLPRPEPGPRSSQDSPTPTRAPASGPERIM
ncbi:protein BEAN1 isoform X1 [Orcinus orca]|uniref:protein BEAN1 isoform X1 n=1 Tax=Orcinus orca TaxID=9733 RepID=UPI00144147DE|nr:protein BEAN1 isoform X1 [Orcinus orca]XP_049558847.1 protein BEAN1 isoform X1 [Orcinus orca]XP_049558848.1 protein BEAN1 isoform X1 [Orcinus orca]